jgi:hypothetical protein
VPGIYRDIMVGTHLTLLISSDTGGYWSGTLEISHEDWARGVLAGRGYDETNESFYPGSCLEATGHRPLARLSETVSGMRFGLTTSYDAIAGDWFVLDYYAVDVGPCYIELREVPDGPLGTGSDLIGIASFNHVASRDFDLDTRVDFGDFALLALYWDEPVAGAVDPNMAFDLNADGWIDTLDLALFGDYWLERTDLDLAADDPSAAETGH